MRIAICDDEAVQVQLIRHYIGRWAEARQQQVECFGFSGAEEYLMHSEEHAFDMLFLDIQMGSISGVELARSLRRHDENVAIVFVTGLREHVFTGYEVQALHYLVKPMREEDCHRCLDLVWDRMQNAREKVLVFSLEGELMRIPFNSIICAEAQGHYLRLVTTGGEYNRKMSLGELEQELAEGSFCRCHRSYLVNLRHVKRLTPEDAILDDDSRVPISRQNREAISRAFVDYHRGRI